jgi:hypothetical protein
MAAAFVFLGMLLLSLVVALLAALQLGDFFATGNELLLVTGAIAVFSIISIAVLAAICARFKQPGLLDAVAIGIAVVAAVVTLWPGLLTDRIAAFASNPEAASVERLAISLELLVPALLVVLVQWGLVRRRALRSDSADDLTRWPWLTTMVAGLAILNPVGLSFVWSAFQSWPAHWFENFAAVVTGGGVFALVVMAAAECYIRGTILRRRRGLSPR